MPLDEKLYNETVEELERDWNLSRPMRSLWDDYAREVAKRYAEKAAKKAIPADVQARLDLLELIQMTGTYKEKMDEIKKLIVQRNRKKVEQEKKGTR